MLGTLFRVLFGFVIACLIAGGSVVAFVITPADIVTLPPELRWDRLGSAGTLSLLAATHAAIFAFPFALTAIAIGEWLSIRSWIYYVLVGIAIAIAGFSAHYLVEVRGEPTIVNDYAVRAFLTLGFFGGFAYWIVAGRRAGPWRGDHTMHGEPRAGGETASKA